MTSPPPLRRRGACTVTIADRSEPPSFRRRGASPVNTVRPELLFILLEIDLSKGSCIFDLANRHDQLLLNSPRIGR